MNSRTIKHSMAKWQIVCVFFYVFECVCVCDLFTSYDPNHLRNFASNVDFAKNYYNQIL